MTTAADWTTHARGLADLMRERGDITTPAWHAAVADVPRHVFVPHVYEQDNTGQWTGWDTADRWDRVYATRTLVTALDSRRGFPEPVSSSTNPELMVRMLELLDFHDGHRVLEIGTGTGYNAALLSHRLGDDRVFSVDIDPDLVALAGERLNSIRFRPTLIAVDGQGGLPQHAPYDRIIATCAVPAVPASWAEQLAPGGAVLVDLKLAISAGNLVHLHLKDGGTLEGRFAPRFASFMAMRHENDEIVSVPPVEDVDGERTFTAAAPVPPWNSPVVWFLAQLSGLPRGVQFGMVLDRETRQPYEATLAAPDGSWSRINLADRAVTESGKTALWRPIELAHKVWLHADQPDWQRLGLTVGKDGQNTVWLDDPDGEHRWQISSN
ncbi:methyltransferase domain-containing protein [Amycolatopsis lurida]|uniref:methyltransferase domain-containing protein n=1 Tax=Amycolatopsis lurida TaxID=31959 RepID=UPI0036564464